MRHRTALLLGALLFGISGLGATVEPTAEQQALALACTGCHGANGRSRGAVPHLAGMEAGRFLAAMRAFQAGKRPATVMNRIAPGYSDAELAVIAAYFESMQP